MCIRDSASDESNGLVTDNVCSLVKIIQKDERIFAAVQFEIKLFDFFYRSKRLLIIVIWTYTVNYRNALDRLRVRMNIILLLLNSCNSGNKLYIILE